MYEIHYHASVLHDDLKKLNRAIQKKILAQIGKKLSISPQTFGKPLRYDLKGYWRLRVENYRVIFEIESKRQIVKIWLIDQRKDDRVYIEFLKRMRQKE
jgi:mRNA interferase RelE/StbE